MKCESIFDILSLGYIQEADGDESSNKDDDLGNIDDDFDIDTSLDDVGSEKSEDTSGSDNQGGEESSSEDNSLDGANDENLSSDNSDGTNMVEDEPVEANTDIFSSLSAEEQKIKIKELKKLFSNLYSSCDEILARIDKLNINEENLDTLSRISSTIYDMKIYISDYMSMVFPNKSYIENDVIFVRFLTIIKSITEILDDITNKYKKEQEKDPNYSKN